MSNKPHLHFLQTPVSVFIFQEAVEGSSMASMIEAGMHAPKSDVSCIIKTTFVCFCNQTSNSERVYNVYVVWYHSGVPIFVQSVGKLVLALIAGAIYQHFGLSRKCEVLYSLYMFHDHCIPRRIIGPLMRR